jgi:hypothetical protein
MVKVVLTGKVKPATASRINEVVFGSESEITSKIAKMNLEIERVEQDGADVTYYLKESAGPQLLCD